MPAPWATWVASLGASLCCTGISALSYGAPKLRSAHVQVDSEACPFDTAYPRQYVAYKTSKPPVLDGNLDEDLWKDVPWTSDFVDISTDVIPRKRSRAKIRFDDEFLYFGALMEEDEIWANITKHDSVIYHDNDFEVFLDPSGSTHYYKEYEVNALGKTWNLCLNRAYADAGYENSTRVFKKNGYDMNSREAVFIDGKLNDARVKSRAWSAEIALPIATIMVNQTANGGRKPEHGTYWRINFSRVQWRVVRQGTAFWKDPKYPREDNWVWNPTGQIQMHLPERWGILQFSTEAPGTTAIAKDPDWRVRHVASAVYDAQKAWAKNHDGVYTSSIKDLQSLSPTAVLDGTCTKLPTISVQDNGKTFKAEVQSKDQKTTASIDQQRLLLIKK
eukprot:gnl/MRDRNA2_/MRDRNA2_108286_c0_seq1.p1 gnl/MRDRNA2_/MRDRNA2_108286_c0~~gnl/MRDRNA2_/MRDRNA2_108286_c0_seq1.p1  ORF type:complete len:419 (+),score=62.21 gnl/MRDRNA2_/MRDRNA2_108286_c0_seq1:91-1257(+)